MIQILKHEFYKVISSKAVVLAVIAVLVFNAARFIYAEYGMSSGVSAGTYNDEWATVREYAPGKESAEVLAWAEAECGREVFEELQKLYGHEAFVDGIEESAKRITGISIFADENSFTYRNALKTQELFSGLREIPIALNSSRGIESATDSEITDILALFFILYIGIVLWCRESENNIKLLIRTSPFGRKHLAAAKLIVMITGSIFAVVALYGTNFLMALAVYGIGDYSSSIIMTAKYSESPFDIPIGLFIVFYFIYKIVAYIWAAFLISMLCNLAKNTIFSCFVIAAVTGVNILCYYGISAVSYLAPVGSLNLFGLLGDNQFFKSYRNLNLFGYPVDVRLCLIILAIVGLVVFGAVSAVVFSKKEIKTNSKRSIKSLREAYYKVRRVFEKHTGLWRHEAYKLMFGQKLLLILAVVLVFQVWRYQPFEVRYVQVKDYYLRYYLEMLSGPATEEKFNFVEEENARLQKIKRDNLGLSNLNIPKEIEKELDKEKAMVELLKRCEYLKQNEGAYFLYGDGFKDMTAESGNKHDLTLALLAMLLVSICISCVHAPDIQSGICRVTSASRLGKREAVDIRLGLIAVLSFVIYLLVYLPDLIQIWVSYKIKFEYLSYPVNSLTWMEKYGTGMNIGMYLFIVYFIRLVAVMTAGITVGALSKKIGNVAYSVLLSVGIAVLPLLVTLIDRKYEFVYLPFSPLAGNMYMNKETVTRVVVAVIWIAVAVFATCKNRQRMKTFKK